MAERLAPSCWLLTDDAETITVPAPSQSTGAQGVPAGGVATCACYMGVQGTQDTW